MTIHDTIRTGGAIRAIFGGPVTSWMNYTTLRCMIHEIRVLRQVFVRFFYEIERTYVRTTIYVSTYIIIIHT